MSDGKSHSFRRYVALIVLLGGMGLCGCRVMGEKSIDHPFDGIAAAIKPNRITCILFVHGMGGYSNGASDADPKQDPAYLLAAIAKLPNLKSTGAAHPVDLDDGAATLMRQDFVDATHHSELRTYKLDWEPITQPLKTEYLGYDSDAQLISKRVNLVNADLRQGILDGAVPDVVLYVGHYKPVIQHAVRAALKRMHTDIQTRGSDQDYEYVFVTWSLGSKIVFDCLADPKVTAAGTAGPTTQAATDDVTFNKIARRTRAVYMCANQLPLLTLGDVQPPDQKQAKPYQALLSVAHRRKAATSEPADDTAPAETRLQIVAFSDPNDLLSYPLPAWLEGSDEATFSNVSISVVKTAIYIPFLGWVYNPETAHTGYAVDDAVVDLIVNGSGSSTGK